MKAVGLLLSVLFLSFWTFARTLSPVPQQSVNSFPAADFVLSAGSSSAQVHSLSFSTYGKILAVGFLPTRVDLWDVASRKKLRSINAGPVCAISSDGRFLATGGKTIDIWDASSGKRIKTLAWKPKNASSPVDNLLFNPATTVLDVSVTGEGTSLYEIPSGKLLTVLENAQRAQFSSDGASLIGGNAKHLTVWSTRDWSVIRDLSLSSDDVTSIAAYPEKDLVVVGTGKSARLLSLSSAHEIVTFGTASTNFAAFSKKGGIVLTSSPSSFAVWDISGRQLCAQPTAGNNATAVSDDDRWLAASASDGKASVAIWDLQKALRQCGTNSSQASGPPASAAEKSPIAQGKTRYADYKCGDCHGANGEGGPDGPDLTTTYMDAGMISRFLDKPSPDAYMKGMPSVPATHPDNKALVAYVVSLKRAPTPQLHLAKFLLGDERVQGRAPTVHKLSATEKAHILDGDFTIEKDVNHFPNSVKSAFASLAKERDFKMANPGEKYQESDVIGEPGLPFRRLLFAGISKDRFFIHYERGGIGHSYHIAIFDVNPGGKVTLIWGGAGFRAAKDLAELRTIVSTGAFADDRAYGW